MQYFKGEFEKLTGEEFHSKTLRDILRDLSPAEYDEAQKIIFLMYGRDRKMGPDWVKKALKEEDARRRGESRSRDRRRDNKDFSERLKALEQQLQGGEEELREFLDSEGRQAVEDTPSSFTDKADKEIMLAAVAKDGDALEHASEALKVDKEFVLAAVAKNGRALEHASEALKADKEVVLAAVAKDGKELQHASEALKADKDVVLAAAKREAELAVEITEKYPPVAPGKREEALQWLYNYSEEMEDQS